MNSPWCLAVLTLGMVTAVAAANPPDLLPPNNPPIIDPEATNAASSSQVGQAVSAPGDFSYTAPGGWDIKMTEVSKFPVAVGPDQGGFPANIKVATDSDNGDLLAYAAQFRQGLQTDSRLTNVVCSPDLPFSTKGGTLGLLLVVTNTVGTTDLAQRYYLFQGPHGKLVVTCTSAASDAAAFGPGFDAAMKTLSLK